MRGRFSFCQQIYNLELRANQCFRGHKRLFRLGGHGVAS